MKNPTEHEPLTNDWRSLIEAAKELATRAHEGQSRKKDPSIPYIIHPERVALICEEYQMGAIVIAAAWLRDVVEDTDVTFQEVLETCGWMVASLVFWMTSPCTFNAKHWGNRAVRKALLTENILHAPVEARWLKLADRLANLEDIEALDPDFRKKYVEESNSLVDALTKSPCSRLAGEGGSLYETSETARALVDRIREILDQHV